MRERLGYNTLILYKESVGRNLPPLSKGLVMPETQGYSAEEEALLRTLIERAFMYQRLPTFSDAEKVDYKKKRNATIALVELEFGPKVASSLKASLRADKHYTPTIERAS
jgi:hypothetical protein